MKRENASETGMVGKVGLEEVAQNSVGFWMICDRSPGPSGVAVQMLGAWGSNRPRGCAIA